MATETQTRLVMATEVSVADGAAPAPWSPPVLTPGPSLPPLSMQIRPRPEERRQRTQAESKAPEGSLPEPTRRPEPSEAMSLEQIALDHPERVAQVLCGMLREAQDDASVQELIAALMIGLGQSTGAGVLAYCADADVERIAQIVMACDRVAPEHRQQAFAAVKQRILAGDYALQGGLDFVRGMLEKALGTGRAQALLNRMTGGDAHLLRNVDPGQIALFIAKEHPQTIAVILSQLDPAQAAGVLDGLSEDLQADVVHRMARLERISPQTLRELEEGLTDEWRAIIAGQIAVIGGPKCVAEMLHHVGRTTEKAVLDAIGKDAPELVENIRHEMSGIESKE